MNCKTCRANKNENEFNIAPRNTSGRNAECKQCQKKRDKSNYHKNKAARLAAAKIRRIKYKTIKPQIQVAAKPEIKKASVVSDDIFDL